jgi:hypothetical protein
MEAAMPQPIGPAAAVLSSSTHDERPFVMAMDDLSAPPGPPSAPTTPRPRGLVGRVFLDRERRLGLGWRLLSYLTLVLAATAGASAVIAGSDPPVGRNLLAHLVAVALAVAVTWL